VKKRIFAWVAAAALASGILVGSNLIAQTQRDKAADTESAGKQWLTTMNKDKDDTVDKKEFLDYMTTEFNKADTDHDGTLDARELGQLRMELSYQQH
jgi:hypothetical protein